MSGTGSNRKRSPCPRSVLKEVTLELLSSRESKHLTADRRDHSQQVFLKSGLSAAKSKVWIVEVFWKSWWARSLHRCWFLPTDSLQAENPRCQ